MHVSWVSGQSVDSQEFRRHIAFGEKAVFISAYFSSDQSINQPKFIDKKAHLIPAQLKAPYS